MPSKEALRQLALARRDAEPDREAKARAIHRQVTALPAFAKARTIAAYVGVRAEVATGELVRWAVAAGQRVGVPWRRGEELELTAIADLRELEPSTFGLLEPPAALRRDPGRRVHPGEVDLVLVPGLAFDPRGGRLGHGRGYYDRFLRRCRPDALRVGLAFECQVVDQVPMGPHDEPMDLIVTESRVIQVRRPRSRSPFAGRPPPGGAASS